MKKAKGTNTYLTKKTLGLRDQFFLILILNSTWIDKTYPQSKWQISLSDLDKLQLEQWNKELLHHLLITQINFSIFVCSSQTMAIPNELWRLEALLIFIQLRPVIQTQERLVLRPSEEVVVWKSLKEVVLKTSFTFLATKFTNSFENKFLPICSFV